ncbi:MAG: hypothetical protein C0593_13070 [Marinilabiliales bacterium]|nr:MAG: hypothetical protein C0593_13070 [Marinilabiliales bacterium]
MVRKDNTYSMKEAISLLLKTYRIEGEVERSKVISAYYDVAGELIVKHTLSVKMKNDTLFVAVDNAALRNELVYSREQLLFLINEKVGKEIVRNVVFR